MKFVLDGGRSHSCKQSLTLLTLLLELMADLLEISHVFVVRPGLLSMANVQILDLLKCIMHFPRLK